MLIIEWSGQIKKIMFPDSSHYKKYNGSCFKFLNEMLSKLQMFIKVTNFMTFSDGLLLLCKFTYKPSNKSLGLLLFC